MSARYDVIVSPRVRQLLSREVDHSTVLRIDDVIWELRTGKAEGAPHQEGFVYKTEAGESIDYEIVGRTLIILHIRLA